MSNRYVRLADSPDRHEIDDEVQAAFDYREEDDDNDTSESRPLNPNASHNSNPSVSLSRAQVPSYDHGSYNFESVDYDFPPPGSPPPLSTNAFPNDIGNSNGYVPAFDPQAIPQPQRPWWKRAASSVLPGTIQSSLGLSPQRPTGVVGGGLGNDGVFANVVAKPAPPVRIQNGDETYLVPEDAQQEAPPSYAAAQADAVPPYWETTVHAPFSPDSMGEMIIDSLPTGSLFSFCWNMLVSISFQFVGFLLTYLLHTSHAARLGSRAGLGVTFIQYGFALRARLNDPSEGSGSSESIWAEWKQTSATPTATAEDGAPTSYTFGGFYHANATAGLTEEQATLIADATTEWLSFFMMTIGWFVLLTSLLGFYRVKRWERSILASQQATQSRDTTQTPVIAPNVGSNLEQTFSLTGMSRIELLRQGFGIPRRTDSSSLPDRGVAASEPNSNTDAQETDAILIPPGVDVNDPAVVRAVQREMALRENLRAAGFL
ncbi:hypothetical protein FA15DRAFT_664319 [Coprinopsis marcescibilis]|uniref:Metal homeostatis protein bsd2 n=1 Tax=Coprinopsis marcescibilis TaxID=230819 RepID=A0A5C3L9K2_COPMA|nr:hypothetical protein FA15DRAFT_664319 [Coprinopsis marcescibilis]